MTFADVRLEVGEPLGSGGYGFKTNITRNSGDFEKRSARRLEPLFKGNIGQAQLRGEMVDHVTAFFNARKGKYEGFRYKFWADYTATHTLKDLGDSAYTQGVLYQVSLGTYAAYKVYYWGGRFCYKRITKLVVGNIKVYLNGVLTPASVDYNDGLVYLTAPFGTPITWSGEFDLPVRFDTDNLPRILQVVDLEGDDPCLDEQGKTLYKFESLPIVELPVDSPVLPFAPAAEIYRNIDIGFTNSSGSEAFVTEIASAGSEFEQAFARRQYPLFAGSLGQLQLRDEIEYFVCVFNVLRGRLTRFLWRNWADYQATHQERQLVSGGKIQGVTMPAAGDGTNQKFQFAKKYISGGQTTIKPIYKPIAPTIYVNGVVLPSGYTINGDGLLTFNTAPAAGAVISWDGEFNLSVRLDDDYFSGTFRRLVTDPLDLCTPGKIEALFDVGGLAIAEVASGVFVPSALPVPGDLRCPPGTEGQGALTVPPACDSQTYQIVNNQCLPGPGLYTTLADCEAALAPRYDWDGSACVLTPGGQYASLAECDDDHSGQFYCSNGQCLRGAGPYNSRQECLAALIPSPFTGGQCRIGYRVDYTVTEGPAAPNPREIHLSQTVYGPVESVAIEGYLAVVRAYIGANSAPASWVNAGGAYILGGTVSNIVITPLEPEPPGGCGNPPGRCP